jgi:hypothetical protein
MRKDEEVAKIVIEKIPIGYDIRMEYTDGKAVNMQSDLYDLSEAFRCISLQLKLGPSV